MQYVALVRKPIVVGHARCKESSPRCSDVAWRPSTHQSRSCDSE